MLFIYETRAKGLIHLGIIGHDSLVSKSKQNKKDKFSNFQCLGIMPPRIKSAAPNLKIKDCAFVVDAPTILE